jgi:2-oxoglutarate ferredoxin oxidoreductase subunit beta
MTTTVQTPAARPETRNRVGLEKGDYKGGASTLCQGCGHNSISSQIIAAAYEMSLRPEELVKFSGIGCSSKSPAYFLNRSHGFNTLHGRMPSVATGAILANPTLKALAVSGDGDTANIGLGQFIHMVRRNVPMMYIVENNGVYGLTKGQFSATADKGQVQKKQGANPFAAIDICQVALAANCGFIARSFAGDPKQVKELIKAALAYRGTAVLDIISPCVTFNNRDESTKSYAWGKEHEVPLHDVTLVPKREDIQVEYDPGQTARVVMHDGSQLLLRKLDKEYDPTDRSAAVRLLEESRAQQILATGLIYFNLEQPPLPDTLNLPETPLSRLAADLMRPSEASLETVLAEFQ